MSAQFGGKAQHLYGPVVSDLKAVGKRAMEWDLNDWKWDGDLFLATPLNSTPSDCRNRELFPVGPEIPSSAGLSYNSSFGSGDINQGNDKGKREMEKRRRAVVVEGEESNGEAAGSLNLKLGGRVYPILEEELKSGKKTKLVGTMSNRAVCQVEDCKADLSNAKDYHRRHKVCDMHSKASKAIVGNVMQRFCQQCSRFHILQEFDEGKRSCRRRLAGHNRRRRKANPDTVVNGCPTNDEKSSSYLLISLLRILSNVHLNSLDQTKEQDLLSHLLGNLAGLAGGRNISGLLQGSQGLLNSGTADEVIRKMSDAISNGSQPTRPSGSSSKVAVSANLQDHQGHARNGIMVPTSDVAQKGIFTDEHGGSLQDLSSSHPSVMFPSRDNSLCKVNEPDGTTGRVRLNNFDLNSAYEDSQDFVDNLERSHVPANLGTRSLDCRLWVHQDEHKSSPTQVSGNSDSTSNQSPSSSSGEAQSRTDRIVFKLFGKDPSEFPLALRTQILDWLSHGPSDVESYIRPGCIILTIYLRLNKTEWEELCSDLGSNLRRLVDASSDSFWKTGWVYTRVQRSLGFVYDGQVVLDAPLPLRSHKKIRISSIKPIAVSVSESARFVVKGFNLLHPTMRLLCALEGKYLAEKTCSDLMEGFDTGTEHDEYISFTCSIPNVTGRGFIEVEDHGLSGSFFPFIVAEKEVCSELCTLEGAIEVAETANDIQDLNEKMEAKNQAVDFIHEIGWLLHRSHLKYKLGHLDPNKDLFPFKRFWWLMEFSMDHDWCAVVKKLLRILFDGVVDTRAQSSVELALLDMGLLHRAVQRNCRPMVELLLKYTPDKEIEKPGFEQKRQVDWGYKFAFKPDDVGPARLTPLHLAASTKGSENVLDALTNDPGMVGIEAWKRARDSTGLTPYDYACMRGHHSYIQLVQDKINKNSKSGHIVLNIPSSVLIDCNIKEKASDEHNLVQVASLQTETMKREAVKQACRLCKHNFAYGHSRASLLYRPAMLSMVAIAAVCVCVALLFKSSPEVLYVFGPFRWELLKYGAS